MKKFLPLALLLSALPVVAMDETSRPKEGTVSGLLARFEKIAAASKENDSDYDDEEGMGSGSPDVADMIRSHVQTTSATADASPDTDDEDSIPLMRSESGRDAFVPKEDESDSDRCPSPMKKLPAATLPADEAEKFDPTATIDKTVSASHAVLAEVMKQRETSEADAVALEEDAELLKRRTEAANIIGSAFKRNLDARAEKAKAPVDAPEMEEV